MKQVCSPSDDLTEVTRTFGNVDLGTIPVPVTEVVRTRTVEPLR